MKLETFFEKFELFAEVPDAVAKMRELVLEWATTGKLVEQSATDESATALIERIENHFSTLRSRKQMRAAPVEELDAGSPSSIPPTWRWVRLGNVVDYGSSEKAESADIPEDAWLLDLEDIERDTSKLLRRKTFRDSPSKSTKTAFGTGDVLYGKLRPYLNKVLVADAPGYCTTEIVPIRAFGFIDPVYLCYALKRPAFLAYANSKSYGMNLPRLGTEDARIAAFPLPPLAEQKRIVAKVDELMALCDRLEAQQQERETRHAALARASLARFANAPTPANLDLLFHKSYDIPPADLRKSILALAVQGKLVPQDPNDEPAEKLLGRIASSKSGLQASGRIGKDKSVDPVDPRSAPFEIPESWRWTKLVEITELITKGSSPKWQGIAYVSESEGILFITSENVGNYRLRKLDNPKYVEKRFNEIEPRSILKNGDILMNLVGASIGRAAVYDLDDGANINQAVALIRLICGAEGFLPSFLLHYLNSPYAIDYMLSSRVVNAQPNISLTDAREFTVPVPPLAEQRRIVAKVDDLMALVDALETRLATARTTGSTLVEAVVDELAQGRALA